MHYAVLFKDHTTKMKENLLQHNIAAYIAHKFQIACFSSARKALKDVWKVSGF